MQKRRLGRTGQLSSVAILGAVALSGIPQSEADKAMERVIEAGVNHIDVAPSYGDAEVKLGPWMVKERTRFFLGCKTAERSKKEAAEELRRSLERLQVQSFDLFQLHGVTDMETLDQATGLGGALEAIVEARELGLTRYIGITGHGLQAPSVFLEALNRFDFDTVLFPLNFILYANHKYKEDAEKLLEGCRQRDVGVMIIKSIAQAPWGNEAKTHATWYKPFEDKAMIQKGVNFALSQEVTGLCSVGDVNLLPKFLQACERFAPMNVDQQEALIAQANHYEPIFEGNSFRA
jgi:aryl-alcohol dehydrogenase-like predicted oxidoreductase